MNLSLHEAAIIGAAALFIIFFPYLLMRMILWVGGFVNWIMPER